MSGTRQEQMREKKRKAKLMRHSDHGSMNTVKGFLGGGRTSCLSIGADLFSFCGKEN